MTVTLALVASSEALDTVLGAFPEQADLALAGITGGAIAVFTGEPTLATDLSTVDGVLGVSDEDAVAALGTALDVLLTDPGQVSTMVTTLFGPGNDAVLDGDAMTSFAGWLLGHSPEAAAILEAAPANPDDTFTDCRRPREAPAPAPDSPLRAARFAGEPVLEACLAGTHRMLQPEEGVAVAKVQAALLDLNHPLPAHGVDGKFGQETGEAVTAFKVEHGLSPSDPVVGKGTMAALDAEFA